MLILHLLGVVKGIPLSKIIDKTFFSIELCGIACSANEKACNILFFNSMNNYCYLGKVLQLPNPNEEEDVVSTDRQKIRDQYLSNNKLRLWKWRLHCNVQRDQRFVSLTNLWLVSSLQNFDFIGHCNNVVFTYSTSICCILAIICSLCKLRCGL